MGCHYAEFWALFGTLIEKRLNFCDGGPRCADFCTAAPANLESLRLFVALGFRVLRPKKCTSSTSESPPARNNAARFWTPPLLV